MEIKWRTIEKDGLPAVGTLCLCKMVHKFNSWADYTTLKVERLGSGKTFQKYDLVYPDKEIIKYIPISELDKEEEK